MTEIIYQTLPYREAGLLAGMLLGDKDGMERGFYELLKNTGFVHLVVVSGSNVKLLSSGLIDLVAPYWGRKKAIIGALAAVWLYAGLAGWEASVGRAVVFLSIYYWAQLWGRKFDVGRGLVAAVVIMAGFNWGIFREVGFWLSLAAFIGVISERYLKQDSRAMGQPVVRQLWLSIWVSLWVTPILGYVFGRMSLVGPVINAVAVIAVEAITVMGGIGLVLATIIPYIGKIIIWLAYPMLKCLVVLAEGAGGIVGMSGRVKFNELMMAGWYLILIYFLAKRKLKIEKN